MNFLCASMAHHGQEGSQATICVYKCLKSLIPGLAKWWKLIWPSCSPLAKETLVYRRASAADIEIQWQETCTRGIYIFYISGYGHIKQAVHYHRVFGFTDTSFIPLFWGKKKKLDKKILPRITRSSIKVNQFFLCLNIYILCTYICRISQSLGGSGIMWSAGYNHQRHNRGNCL